MVSGDALRVLHDETPVGIVAFNLVALDVAAGRAVKLFPSQCAVEQ